MRVVMIREGERGIRERSLGIKKGPPCGGPETLCSERMSYISELPPAMPETEELT